MRRSAALASLSRDHHQALSVALRLRRADAGTAGAVRADFQVYWSDHGHEHFRREEEILLPAYAAHGDAHHPLVLRALGDHVEIRWRARRMADGEGGLEDLHVLGRLLAEHVRLEERELFVLIEAAMPAAELAAVAEALEAERPR